MAYAVLDGPQYYLERINVAVGFGNDFSVYGSWRRRGGRTVILGGISHDVDLSGAEPLSQGIVAAYNLGGDNMVAFARDGKP